MKLKNELRPSGNGVSMIDSFGNEHKGRKFKLAQLSIDDLDMLWIGSFRYYLGRMTISTHSYCETLMNHFHTIPKRAQEVIKRDLAEEIKRDDSDRENEREHKTLGHDCDSQKWREVMRRIESA
jgi:hypothetical protein